MNKLRVRPEAVVQLALALAVAAFLGGTLGGVAWLKTAGAALLGVVLLAGLVVAVVLLFTPSRRVSHLPNDAPPQPRL
jgi:Na+(H+)/acetate symporter ActP